MYRVKSKGVNGCDARVENEDLNVESAGMV